MYSVQQLAKMYKCSRATIYTKLEHGDIQQFLYKDDKGLKLIPEGLSVFNTIISGSKIKPTIQQVYIEPDTKYTEGTDYIDKLINSLEAQINELKLDKEKLQMDKEKLFNELEAQRQILLLVAPEQTEPVVETTIQDAVQQTKKLKWKFWQ